MALTNGHSSSVNTLSLSESSVLASGGDDGVICLWDPSQQHLIAKRQFSSEESVSCVLFSDVQHHRLLAAHGGQVLVWDIRHFMHPVQSWCVSDEEVNCITLLESENRLATADDNGYIKIFNFDTGELVRSLHKHNNIASSVLFRPGKNWQVISGGLDCRLVVTDWKGHRGEAVNIFDIAELIDPELTASGPELGINPPLVHSLACTSDGEFVAAGLENGSVELFSGSGRHLLHTESLYGHSQGVSALLCLPGHLLLSGGNDADCFLWNLDSDGAGGSFSHSEKINALCGRLPEQVFVADSGSAIHCCDLNLSQLQSAAAVPSYDEDSS